MAEGALRKEEYAGLGVAIVAHAALVALLLMPRAAPVVVPPDRIEVTISDNVGLTSTSPEPAAQAAPDVAPELGEPPPPEPETAPPAPRAEPPKSEAPKPPPPKPQPPKPQPKAEPPKPAPRPVASPRPVPKPVPRPVPRPTMRPEPPRPVAKPTMRPAPRPAPAPARPAARPVARTAPPLPGTTAPRPATRPATRPAGASRVGDDFLKGVPGARTPGQAANPPAQAAGPQVQASLLGAISRELRPHWQGKVPEGADSEKLVTILRWNINRDGTLAGRPEVVRQEGITDANRPQADRHAEQAIRAVQLAAPFDLPDQYYDTWKRVTIRFDKRLSQ